MNSSHPHTSTGLPAGTVYGAILNDRATIDRLAPEFGAAPYKAAPVAPVLYIKSHNTLVSDGAVVGVPAQPGTVRVDATVGAVIGRRASRVPADEAMQFVRGLVIASDLTLPHESYYRPAVRQRCRDGFCPMSVEFAADTVDLASSKMTVTVNGLEVHRRAFSGLVRSLPQLIADVSEFITLEVGDVLLVGPPEGAPLARPGDLVELCVPGLGSLSHSLAVETSEEFA